MEQEKDFYISELSGQDDKTFLLGIHDGQIERLYTVTVRVNRQGELVGLKSEKKS